MRRNRVYPRRLGFYGTVFSQPVFWLCLVVVFVVLTIINL